MHKTGSILIVSLLFLAGCSSWSQMTEQDVQNRYQAAMSIKDNAERWDVLCSLALKAAKAGMDEIAEDVIKDIGPNDNRASIGRQCALILAKQGKTVEAIRIAKSIGPNALRDKTLAQIARY